MAKKVVVLGANFGGLTAALSLKKDLGNDVDVKVVSDRDYFLFNPSLIWLPFGSRDTNDVSFKVGPTFENGGVDFIQSAATEIHRRTGPGQRARTAHHCRPRPPPRESSFTHLIRYTTLINR